MNRMGVYRGSSDRAAAPSCERPASDAPHGRAGVHAADASTGELGTLLWVGASLSREFADAQAFCLEHAPQVAIRKTVQDAMNRPAGAVRAILIAESTRQPVSSETVTQFRLLYPEAAIACLMGAGCEGMHAKVLQPSLSRESRFYGHQWNQALPRWLATCGATAGNSESQCNSVAVVASSMSNAEAMMDLAESAGTAAVWCRDEHACHVRGVDAVWWDDSIAPATNVATWRTRLQRFASRDSCPKHAWIANLPRPNQQAAAKAAGVDLVLSKPYRIDALLGMLGESVLSGDASTALRRAA